MFDPCETAAKPANAANELTPDQESVRRFAALATVPIDRLSSAINRCCAARGDDEGNRLALLAECARQTPADRLDLAEHFEEEAARWEAAAHSAK